MRKFKVFVSETAGFTLKEMDQDLSNRIKSHLKELETDPFTSRPKADIKRLHGFEKPYMYRLRIGDYRALYFVIGDEIKVTEIIHRGKDYVGIGR